jgi:hypothetical protein
VGCLCPAAVKALSMEMLMEVSFAVGWRTKWRRFSVASTIAMLKSVKPEVSGPWSELQRIC